MNKYNLYANVLDSVQILIASNASRVKFVLAAVVVNKGRRVKRHGKRQRERENIFAEYVYPN
jgi:hypothetical protein